MTYTCPVCGIADPHAFIRCYHGACPDGRDQPHLWRDPPREPARESPARSNPFTLILLAAIVALLCSIFMLLATPRARAMDHGFNPTDATVQWFEKLMRPPFPTSSCCGKADSYPVSRYWRNKDANGTPTGTWTAVIGDGSAKKYPDGTTREYIATGTEVQVYDNVVNEEKDDLDNPTDTSWIFMRVVNGSAENVYCFIRHPEGN